MVLRPYGGVKVSRGGEARAQPVQLGELVNEEASLCAAPARLIDGAYRYLEDLGEGRAEGVGDEALGDVKAPLDDPDEVGDVWRGGDGVTRGAEVACTHDS